MKCKVTFLGNSVDGKIIISSTDICLNLQATIKHLYPQTPKSAFSPVTLRIILHSKDYVVLMSLLLHMNTSVNTDVCSGKFGFLEEWFTVERFRQSKCHSLQLEDQSKGDQKDKRKFSNTLGCIYIASSIQLCMTRSSLEELTRASRRGSALQQQALWQQKLLCYFCDLQAVYSLLQKETICEQHIPSSLYPTLMA